MVPGARGHYTPGMAFSGERSSALCIAVVGPGGVGSMFAYHLSRAGHDVTVVARPGSTRLAQLRRDRGIVRTSNDRADTAVADALDEQVAYDLVIVTTPAHQAAAVLPALARSKARRVQFMFNVFDPERLRDAVGADRASFGMPFVRATVNQAGALDAKFNPGQRTLHGERRWADVFSAAGVPSAFEPEMMLWLRCHVPLCVAFESIAIAGQRRGGGATWSESNLVARGMRDAFAIVRGLGDRLYPSSKAIVSSVPTVFVACLLWLLSRVASFRALLARGAGECRALIDAMVDAASAAKLPALPSALLAIRPAQEPRP